MASWFRVPAFLGGRLHGDHVATEHEAWTDLLGRWHMGEDVSACAFAEATKWGKGRVLKFMPKVAEWANEAGATVPRRWQADRNADQDRTVMRTDATEVQPAQSDDVGPETDRTPDRNRTASRARLPLERDREVDVDQTAPPDRADAIRRPVPVRLDDATVTDAPAAAPTATPLVLSDAWAKHLPTDTTTTDTPAPVKARPVKRTPRTTPDTHAREVIGGWCDAYREATGATYAITGADSGKLRRAAADYATGEAWADGVERLTRGMATYIRDPKRFPPGPPTVTGFLIDPQRWIAIAESASPAANGPPVAPAPIDTNPFRRTKP